MISRILRHLGTEIMPKKSQIIHQQFISAVQVYTTHRVRVKNIYFIGGPLLNTESESRLPTKSLIIHQKVFSAYQLLCKGEHHLFHGGKSGKHGARKQIAGKVTFLSYKIYHNNIGIRQSKGVSFLFFQVITYVLLPSSPEPDFTVFFFPSGFGAGKKKP